MDSDDDIFNDEKNEFVVGFGQLSQLGPRQKEGLEAILNAINSGEGMGAALRRASQLRIDPVDRFKILASIYYEKFGGEKSYFIKWNTLISKVPLMKWVKYKNPIGFVLGARILNAKMEIDKSRLELIFAQFSELLKVEGIQREDVLRYASNLKLYL